MLSFVAFSKDVGDESLLLISELEGKLAGSPKEELTCQIQGVVRAIISEEGLVAVQDASGVMLFELPQLSSQISAGDKIVIEAKHCVFSQTRFGVRIEDIAVVDNDGLHPDLEKSGSVLLHAGMNPIRVDWFNGPAEFSLNLDFEGPGIQRQMVPGSILWHGSNVQDGRQDLRPGLFCQSYEGLDWLELPDFSLLNPTAKSIATNFSTSYRTRDERCGLAFRGYIQIDHPGRYTFYLKSDDGSRLYAGESAVACKVLQPATGSPPAPDNLEQAMADHRVNHWIQMEGEVTFASQNERDLCLEVMAGGDHVPVTVVDGRELMSNQLLHAWIQVQGICGFSRDPEEKRLVGIFVPGSRLVNFHNPVPAMRADTLDVPLTTAAQVRQLKAAEARKHIPARIHGVVIYASSAAAVVHDSTGGIFISWHDGYWSEEPAVGELWDMEGFTESGFFSPVIVINKARFLGYAPLPEPIKPTWDQLMNGNMDAEYGELHGVVTSISSNEFTLLTPDGQVSVMGISDRPLPQLPKTIPEGGSLIGSVVRIRGCFATLVDIQTRHVTPGKVYIYPGLMEVEDPAPADPFRIPVRTPADLMWFNAPAIALQRTRLAGQVLGSQPGEYFVLDGKTGFRVSTTNSSLMAGDFIEAVGFPKLGGPSPVLQGAQTRMTGHAALPEPVFVSAERLLARELDSTLVRVDGVLISDSFHQGERVLELQTGAQHFEARLESVAGTFAPLPAGCRLRATGVYISEAGDEGGAGSHIAPFELLLNNSSNIVVLQLPPWWTIKRVAIVLMIALGILGTTLVWVALLRRKIEQRTVQLKREIEQRQLVEQNHVIELERTRVARDLHDELGSGLTEVGLLGSLANTAAVEPEAKHRYLNQITQVARSLVTSLDEIVWAVNPHHDSLGSLVSYFSLYAESFFNLAGITCRLRVAENIPQCPLDSKQRHGVFCVFKEALNNVVRHSKATEAQIIFDFMAEKLELSVIDNGCGFEAGPEIPGKDGLASLRQRMQELGGSCQITSQPGSGTTVRISLPVNQNHNGQISNR